MEVIMEESGMRFAKYSEDEVFEIEKSPQYTKSLRQKGVKICEFVLRRGNKIYFMEAKSSCPRQIVWDNPKDDREQRKRKYEEYIEEINRFKNETFSFSIWKYSFEKVFAEWNIRKAVKYRFIECID